MKPTKSSVEVTLFNDASFAATDTESCSFFKAHRRLNFLLSLWTIKPHVRFLGLLFARYHELGGFKQQNLSSPTLEPGVQNQGVGRTVLPLKPLGENPFLPLLALASANDIGMTLAGTGMRGALGIPWL